MKIPNAPIERDPIGTEVWVEIPLVPVSVNHYVKHTRSGRHFITSEAKTFLKAVEICAGKKQIRGEEYALLVHVFFGKGQRGDGDNLWKLIADGLVKAGVIHSDAAVKDWHLLLSRDPQNPRTLIMAKVIG